MREHLTQCAHPQIEAKAAQGVELVLGDGSGRQLQDASFYPLQIVIEQGFSLAERDAHREIFIGLDQMAVPDGRLSYSIFVDGCAESFETS